jgi:UDP-galactopyranose mutase
MKPYDYLIVGSGLYGATFAHIAKNKGKKCLVIDKRPHKGGNVYCENIENINVHKYGAHIFHTSNKEVWNFVNSIVEFNSYINSPVANYKGKLYNLPFNMNTFYSLWGVKTPEEAKAKIAEQRRKSGIINPRNLEEQAISLVGNDIYETLIKGYTEKQWGRKCTELPADIIRRLPVRFTFNNNYFNDRYQGVPIGGYNRLVDGLLKDIEVRCNTDFFHDRAELEPMAEKILFTGKIDEFYNYSIGKLNYRTLKFETEIINCENYQGVAVVNYTEAEIPYTRIIEHKHFESPNQPKTVITKEFPSEWTDDAEAFYPINDDKNNRLYQAYHKAGSREKNIIFGGRLAEYRYYDMDKIIEKILIDESRKI